MIARLFIPPFKSPSRTLGLVAVLATVCAALVYGLWPSPVLEAPEKLVATDGGSPSHVGLSWSPVEDADYYRIYRDGRPLVEVEAPTFIDQGASAGSVPEAPEVDAVWTGADEIELSWDEPGVEGGNSHVYEVRAVDGDRISEPSVPTVGSRAPAPVESYEFRVGEDSPTDVGDRTSLTYPRSRPGLIELPEMSVERDEEGEIVDVQTEESGDDEPGDRIEPPQLGAPEIRVEFVEEQDRVELQAGRPEVTGGEAPPIRVRALNDVGAGDYSAPTPEAIPAGKPEIQWQRSLDHTTERFAAIDGADSIEFSDEYLPAGKFVRHYRLKVDAPGAEAVFSESRSVSRVGSEPEADVPLSMEMEPEAICEEARDVSGCECYRNEEYDLELCIPRPTVRDPSSQEGVALMVAGEQARYRLSVGRAPAVNWHGTGGGATQMVDGFEVRQVQDDVALLSIEFVDQMFAERCSPPRSEEADHRTCGVGSKPPCRSETAAVVDLRTPSPRLLGLVDWKEECFPEDAGIDDVEPPLTDGDQLDRSIGLVEEGGAMWVDDERFELDGDPVLFPFRDQREGLGYVSAP